MKRRVFLGAVLVVLGASLFFAQRGRIDAPVSARAILYLVGDSERELTRLPAKFTRISDSDEISVGNKIAESFLSGRRDLAADAQAIEAYIRQVGGQLAPYAQRKLPYQFHYIPDRNFINAFALPGGHVFIGAGLIERMDTEDELATVLGHELEHVDHYHCAERLQVEAALRKVPLGELLGIPIALFQAGYSKDQELEADREGVLLAARAGYSANGAIRMFETFDQLFREVTKLAASPQQELSRVASDVLTGYFRSHPLPEDRISQIKEMIARQPALASSPEKDLKVHYISLAWQSSDQLAGEKFDKAAELASRSLEIRSDYKAALQLLAEAKFGLEDFPAAQTAYRALLAQDTAAAGAVESWAESRAQRFLEQGKYDHAVSVVQALLELQPNQPKLLRLLALAQAGNGDFSGTAATAGTLRRLYADVADQLATEAQQRGANLLSSAKFAEASGLSKLCLALRPEYFAAMRTLAEAEFAQAHFAESASAYQQLFQVFHREIDDLALLRAFADALGSAYPATAARDLEAALSRAQRMRLSPSAIKTEVAGLALMGGTDGPARELQQATEKGEIAPELLARLGWWYFRARRMDEASAVLQKVLALRPSDPEALNNLAWVDLEQGKEEGSFTEATYGVVGNDATVGAAIAKWEQRQVDAALRSWPAVRSKDPQWLNQTWRTAIYPPRVAEAVQEIEVEQQRRELARRVPPGR